MWEFHFCMHFLYTNFDEKAQLEKYQYIFKLILKWSSHLFSLFIFMTMYVCCIYMFNSWKCMRIRIILEHSWTALYEQEVTVIANLCDLSVMWKKERKLYINKRCFQLHMYLFSVPQQQVSWNVKCVTKFSRFI